MQHDQQHHQQQKIYECIATSPQPYRAVGRKMYFKVLKIQPIQLNVTLIPSPSSGPDAPEARSRYRVAAALGIQYANISDVPIKISSLELYDAFLSGSQLGEAVRQHLVSTVRCHISVLILENVLFLWLHDRQCSGAVHQRSAQNIHICTPTSKTLGESM